MSKRMKYLPAFKSEVVEVTRMDGMTVSQIARDPGIGANMRSRWRREQAADSEKALTRRAC